MCQRICYSYRTIWTKWCRHYIDTIRVCASQLVGKKFQSTLASLCSAYMIAQTLIFWFWAARISRIPNQSATSLATYEGANDMPVKKFIANEDKKSKQYQLDYRKRSNSNNWIFSESMRFTFIFSAHIHTRQKNFFRVKILYCGKYVLYTFRSLFDFVHSNLHGAMLWSLILNIPYINPIVISLINYRNHYEIRIYKQIFNFESQHPFFCMIILFFNWQFHSDKLK